MINMVQSPVRTEKHQADIINTIKMVQNQEVIVKPQLATTNMINMVVKQEVIKQVQMGLQSNTTNTEERQVLSKKIPPVELQNTINMVENLGVINNA